MLKLSHSFIFSLKSSSKRLSVIRYEKYLKSTAAPEITLDQNRIEQPRKSRPSRMVAAAFASIKPQAQMLLEPEIDTPLTDDRLKSAKTVEELLSVSEGSGVSRRHALKVVSTLADWSSSGKVKVSDFENDTRFIKLCRVLSKGAKVNRHLAARNEDISTILGVAADDEAARLISGLNLAQMVKVMSTLSARKRRSVLLLRTLAYNLTAINETFNLKQSADLLYSMCVLNFIDMNLIERICEDVSKEIVKEVKSSAVVGSIITSIGVLKYKNCEMLDILSEWILKNHKSCRMQDIFSLFTTLATINYLPTNSERLFDILLPQMTMSEAQKLTVWLNFVWSLLILNRVSDSHIASVLSSDFIKNMELHSTNPAVKLKLLNVNAAAQFLQANYKGDFLPSDSIINEVTITKTKEKTEMKELVVDALKNLINIEKNVSFDVNLGIGFSIDIECCLNEKFNPLPLSEALTDKKGVHKIAILVHDYHDMCLGIVEPSGMNVLGRRLLEAQNYKVLAVPYTEFKSTDKLVQRVQYLENKLKKLLNNL